MKRNSIFIVGIIIILVIFLIIKILKWPIIIGGLVLLIYAGYLLFWKKRKK